MDSLFDNNLTLEQLMPLIQECLSEGKTVKFSPRGTSMLPMLRQGIDSVVLAPLPEKLKKYDLPLYQRSNGQYVLHRIIDAGDTYTCVGDNQITPEPGLSHDQMIAVVTAFYRGSRLCRVTDTGYQIYCRFWHYSRQVRFLCRKVKGVLRRHLK